MTAASALLLISLASLAGCTAATDGALTTTVASQLTSHDSGRHLPAGDVVVDVTKPVAKISSDAIGINLGVWYSVRARHLPAEIASLRPRILRWPGGSTADAYHWQHHTQCDTQTNRPGPADARASTFENFMRDIVIPGHYAVAITVNYGSNETCTGGGRPREAAAWVAYARRNGFARYIQYWTVGNEAFGSWEYDLHAHPHDPQVYAHAMAGPKGFYASMKAADPHAQVGVIVTGERGSGAHWDRTVLAKAPYDFVELHAYAQNPGHEGDRDLLDRGPARLGAAIATVRRELAAAGRPTTPILLGEFNSVAYAPGKQTVSIVNALYTGLAFGEVLQAGVKSAIWWFGVGGTENCQNNNSRALYGWQHFGGYDLVAADTRHHWNGCGKGPVVPDGALFPSGDAFRLVSRFVGHGGRMLAVTVSLSLPEVRAYADVLGPGHYAVMLFNLNETTPYRVTLALSNAKRHVFRATAHVYDKRLYDASRHNIWLQPVTASLGTVHPPWVVTLAPWSLTVLTLK